MQTGCCRNLVLRNITKFVAVFPKPKLSSSPVITPKTRALVRFFRWRHRATMVATQRLSIASMARQEVAILLCVDDDEQDVEVTSQGYSGRVKAMVTQPLARHSIRARCRTVGVVVNLTHSRYPSLIASLKEPVKVLDRKSFSHLDEQIASTFHRTLNSEESQALIESIIDVVLQGSPPVKRLDPRIPWIMIKLEEDIDYPFEKLAAELELSESRLSHLFSKELGISYRSYQAWSRAVLAWELVVMRRDLSVAHIAQMMGFSDTSHMSRTFQQGFGMTPTQLRNPAIAEVIGPSVIPSPRFSSDPP